MTRLYDMTIGQAQQFMLAFQNAGMSLEQAEYIIQQPQRAVDMLAALQVSSPAYPVRDFSRYNSCLLPLEDQLQQLTELNKKLPKKLKVAASRLDLDTASNHVQSVEDLESFFIVLDTLEETIAVNWELIKLTQPAIYHSGFATDADNLRLGPNTKWYKPGIHRVRINLVDNWDPENGRSIDDVRALAGSVPLLGSGGPQGVPPLVVVGRRQQVRRCSVAQGSAELGSSDPPRARRAKE